MDWNSSVKYKPSFDTGDFISRDKYPGIEKDTGINWGDAFNTKLPSSLTDTKPKNNWGEIFGGLFDKAKNTDKYRDESQRPSFGESTRGGGGQILENLSALYPQQHAPMFIPGQESSGGVGSAIGTLAGIGASFIPGMGPGIAKALPAIGGSIGSFF
jgi:hypothetical protein